MNYGLYLSASGVLTNMYRQDVLANNLANVETVAFKPDLPDIRQRDPAAAETHAAGEVSRALLDRLGGGALAGPQRIDFTAGVPRQTGNPLDIALSSPDTFLAVQAPKDGKGAAQGSGVRLTRDGRLGRDAEGYLITASGGFRVLGAGDQPIQLSGTGPVHIDSSGRVIQDGQAVAQLQISGVTDKTRLKKEGGNLFAWDGKDIRTTPTDPTVMPGFVESSGTDPMRTLIDMIATTSAIENNANMIHYHDLLMDRAVNVLGRVA